MLLSVIDLKHLDAAVKRHRHELEARFEVGQLDDLSDVHQVHERHLHRCHVTQAAGIAELLRFPVCQTYQLFALQMDDQDVVASSHVVLVLGVGRGYRDVAVDLEDIFAIYVVCLLDVALSYRCGSCLSLLVFVLLTFKRNYFLRLLEVDFNKLDPVILCNPETRLAERLKRM